MSGRVSAIVLAAGLSRRMRQNKLLMPYRGKPIVQHVLELVSRLAFWEKILVSTRETVSQLRVPDCFTVLINVSPGLGQGESARMAVEAATGGYYMFFAGDTPLLDEATVLLLLNQIEENRIIVPTADGNPGSPCIFPRSCREELLALRGDQGGRTVRDAHPGLCKHVEVPDANTLRDIDTIDDYNHLTLM